MENKTLRLMRLLLLIAVLALTSCGPHPVNPDAYLEKVINACVPTAITMRQSLKAAGIWAELYKYNGLTPKDKFVGHAMVAYVYHGELWTYDHKGSYRHIGTDRDDIKAVVAAAISIRKYKYKVVFNEVYL